MTTEQIQIAIACGFLRAADVTEASAYVYYEPESEHEHAAHYVRQDGAWMLGNMISGDLPEALGGEAAEDQMIALLLPA